MGGIASKPIRPFVVMVKPVGSRCNLACDYCYYNVSEGSVSEGNNTSQSDTANYRRMTDEILEMFIRQYIEASEGPEVHIVWHGGEPTLAGLDFFKKAVVLEKRYLPENWSCRNNLQTNGVLLNDAWCGFLAEEKFDVGLSVDGTLRLHDQYRKDHGGGGSFMNASAAVRRLRDYGVQPDLLCTVTSSAAKEPLEVYRALREFDTGWIQFIPIVRRDSDGRLTPDSVAAFEYGEFLSAVFKEWALNDIGRLDVQLFAEAARVWSGGSAGLCWMTPVCGRALIVEMDGGVYSCDHYVYPKYRVGDIKTSHIGDIVELPTQISFGDKKRDLSGQCRICPWLSVCNGGCPKDRFATENETNGEPPLNHLCAGLKRFFAYAYPIAARILNLARGGLSPAAIMLELRGQV